ncbi:MAG: hypothetical protein CM1200mP16_07600 [Nitrospina sp.]|nr:MAG: hypothetical protein CM1200mP16_07600 [Nitrospina sp.]
MDEKNNGHLHELIIGGIEKPLVEIVLKETNGNQTQAAKILGIKEILSKKDFGKMKLNARARPSSYHPRSGQRHSHAKPPP